MPNNLCWICSKPADTAEHAVKKSDLIRIAGSKIFGKHNRLIKHTADKKIIIQGPDSKYVKYEKSLCKKCNNEISQPFDRAYDIFICAIIENSSDILKSEKKRFNKIYKYNTKLFQYNLFKYFVKSFGCQLVENCEPVPEDLVQFLNGKCKRHNLVLAFSIRSDIPNTVRSFSEFYQVHNLEKIEDAAKLVSDKFMWAETIGWLRISYWYNCVPEENAGSVWAGCCKQIVLGRC